MTAAQTLLLTGAIVSQLLPVPVHDTVLTLSPHGADATHCVGGGGGVGQSFRCPSQIRNSLCASQFVALQLIGRLPGQSVLHVPSVTTGPDSGSAATLTSGDAWPSSRGASCAMQPASPSKQPTIHPAVTRITIGILLCRSSCTLRLAHRRMPKICC
jgi:hypothetical protein